MDVIMRPKRAKRGRRNPGEQWRVPNNRAWTHWLTVPTATYAVRVDDRGRICEVADLTLTPFIGETFDMLIRAMSRRWAKEVAWMRL